MKSVQIKNVPEETHRVLRTRAAHAGQSLQEYLRSRLIEEAARPTMQEVLDRIEKRKGSDLSLKSVVETVRYDRDSH